MSRIPPLQTLPTFRAVARTANLRAAADTLHLTHSAVSQQIRLLEERLGFPLFDRRGRRVVLNAAGAALLQAVETGLTHIESGVRAAAAAHAGTPHRLRLTLLPSFAQRWLLPRMGRWRTAHPEIGLELHTSQALEDLAQQGFHAALRQGAGRWRGLRAEPLIDSPLITLGSPDAARRLQGRGPAALADEPLLGSQALWEAWFAAAGVATRVNPVAAFNDAALMLQATEQNLGIAMARELLAADALCSGRLVRLSPVVLEDDEVDSYWLAYPPELEHWAPLVSLRAWLLDELEGSKRELKALSVRPGTRLEG